MSVSRQIAGLLGEWDIAARASRCTRTGREFEDGEQFFTLLFDTPEGFRREDLSDEAWREFCQGGEEPPFSFWKTKYQALPPPEEETLLPQNAETLLRKLLSDGPAPQYENVCYILALMLERKRTLRQVDAKESGDVHLLIYEHAKTGEAFIVKDPRLHLEQIEAVQREVATILEEGLPGGGAQKPPA